MIQRTDRPMWLIWNHSMGSMKLYIRIRMVYVVILQLLFLDGHAYPYHQQHHYPYLFLYETISG